MTEIAKKKRREYGRTYYQAHKEELAEYKRKYREANREAMRKYNNCYYAQNRKKRQADESAYRKRNWNLCRERMEPVREARLKAGLTQREIAEALGVAHTTYSNWETGQVPHDPEEIMNVIAEMAKKGADR